jgi:hypothetical protein
MEDTFYDDLKDNVIDWFYTYHSQSAYSNDNNYIEDIRSMIVYHNDTMVNDCISDLSNVYRMDHNKVLSYKKDVANTLSSESQYALDNFHYRNMTDM